MNEDQHDHEGAVEATLADLRLLGSSPVEVVAPPEVVARIEATLAALAAGGPDVPATVAGGEAADTGR